MERGYLEQLARSVAMKHLCRAREAGQLGDFDEVDKHLAVVKWCRGVLKPTADRKVTRLRTRSISRRNKGGGRAEPVVDLRRAGSNGGRNFHWP